MTSRGASHRQDTAPEKAWLRPRWGSTSPDTRGTRRMIRACPVCVNNGGSALHGGIGDRLAERSGATPSETWRWRYAPLPSWARHRGSGSRWLKWFPPEWMSGRMTKRYSRSASTSPSSSWRAADASDVRSSAWDHSRDDLSRRRLSCHGRCRTIATASTSEVGHPASAVRAIPGDGRRGGSDAQFSIAAALETHRSSSAPVAVTHPSSFI